MHPFRLPIAAATAALLHTSPASSGSAYLGRDGGPIASGGPTAAELYTAPRSTIRAPAPAPATNAAPKSANPAGASTGGIRQGR